MSDSQREFMQQVSKVIVETVCSTVNTLFSIPLKSEEVAGIDKICDSDFICLVRLHDGEEPATVRYGFEYSLMRRLVTAVYSEEMANDKAVLQDAGSEVANIVTGKVKEFINAQGHNLTADIPATIEGPFNEEEHDQTIDLIFYNAEDHLVVDVELGFSGADKSAAR